MSVFSTRQTGFNRDWCLSQVSLLLSNGSLTSNDTRFYRNQYGAPMSNPNNPVLTLGGCNEICGAGRGWYTDIGPRLSTWLIPVFLLLSNMEVSPLDKRRYLMLVHLLGDPIDSLWCLLLKIDGWSRCMSLSLRYYDKHEMPQPPEDRKVRNLATLLGGIEELAGYHTEPSKLYSTIKSQSALTTEQLEQHIARAAQQLSDNRTDERLRTLLATALYFYQLVSAFVATVGGGSTSPPGGRIGIAMFMTWIIPSILLSNAIGGFTSMRTCFVIIENFFKDATSTSELWPLLQGATTSLGPHETLDEYFDSLSWSGAIYTYRPRKTIRFGNEVYGRRSYFLLILAISPIAISSIIASVILWNTPPIGINCRNLLVFGIVILLFLSTASTWLISKLKFRGSTTWHITLAKDALIAVPSVVLIFLATSGLFNTCWCWSGYYSLRNTAHVPLNPLPQFQSFNRTTYPVLVGVCLLLQLVAFAVMIRVSWVGWNLMRWSEKEKRDSWNESRRSILEQPSKDPLILSRTLADATTDR